jgi:hypothetical protein
LVGVVSIITDNKNQASIALFKFYYDFENTVLLSVFFGFFVL